MSGKRAKIIEEFFDAWNRRDLARVLEMTADGFEYVNPPNAVEPGVRRGADGLELVVSKQWAALGPGGRVEIDRMHHLGDQVVAETRLSREMPGSTARLEVKAVVRLTFSQDLLSRMEVLGTGPTYDEGLAEAGVA